MKNSGSEALRKSGPEASQGPGTDKNVIFLEKTDIFGGQSIDGLPLGVFYRFMGDFFRKIAFWAVWAKKYLPGTDHYLLTEKGTVSDEETSPCIAKLIKGHWLGSILLF